MGSEQAEFNRLQIANGNIERSEAVLGSTQLVQFIRLSYNREIAYLNC
jgi:hypothetical protein